jgi:hypothetical protein
MTVTWLSVSPGAIVSGSIQNMAVGTVTIQRAPGETGGMYVSVVCLGDVCNGLSVSQPYVQPGQNSATFSVGALGVATSPQIATFVADSQSASLTVNPFTVSLSLSTSRIVAGSMENTATATVKVDAPVRGTVSADLSCTGLACSGLSMPTVVTFQPGATTATFSAGAAGLVSAEHDASITVTLGTIDSRILAVAPFLLGLRVPAVLMSGTGTTKPSRSTCPREGT